MSDDESGAVLLFVLVVAFLGLVLVVVELFHDMAALR